MNLESACKLWSKLQCYNACTSSGENNSRWFDGAQLTVTYEIDRDMFTFESYCICTRERQKRSGEQMKFYYPTSDLTKWCNVYNLEGWWWGSCDFLVCFLFYLSCLGCSYFYLKCTGACACTCSVVFLVRHDVVLLVVCFLEWHVFLWKSLHVRGVRVFVYSLQSIEFPLLNV